MSDSIYRQAAIDAVHWWYKHMYGEDAEKWICESIENLPSAEPEITEEAVKDYCQKRCLTVLTNEFFHYLKTTPPTASQWIPCSERLPDVSGAYFVTGKQKYSFEKEWQYFVDIGYTTCSEYMGEFWDTCNDWDEGQETHIIAWMPIPEPWKGEL